MPGTNAQKLGFASDGTEWFGVGAPDELLLGAGSELTPARHKIGNVRIVNGGWLEGGRVFVAYQAFGATINEGGGHVVKLWDATKGERAISVQIPTRSPPLSASLMDVSRSGRYAAQGSAIYDLEAGRWVRDSAPHAGQSVLEFLGDEWVLTASHHDERVLLRRLSSDESHAWRAPDRVNAARVDVHLTIYAGTTGGVCVFSVGRRDGECVRLGLVRDLKLFDSGVAALGEGQVWLLDRRTLVERATIRLPSRPTVLATDGPIIAVGDEDGNVSAWDGVHAARLAEQKALPARVVSIAVSQRERRVLASALVGGDSQLVRLHWGGPGSHGAHKLAHPPRRCEKAHGRSW